MKLRRYTLPAHGDLRERGILLIEPDDPEELVPLGAGEIGAIPGAEIDAALEPSAISISWMGSLPPPPTLIITDLCMARAFAEWRRTVQTERRKE